MAQKTLRGGCWTFDANLCRSTLRAPGQPSGLDDTLGFRLLEPTATDYQRRFPMTNIVELEVRIAKLEALIAQQKEELTVQIAKAPPPEMVKLPDRAYKVSKYHITEAQYATFARATNREYSGSARPDYPVVNVTYHDAQAYADWLSAETGRQFRLPTEDEYEHFRGNQEVNHENFVYDQNEIAPVGTKRPNEFGIYDAAGLAWIWTSSDY